MSERNNPVLEKSFAFAVRIVKLYKYMMEEKREFTLAKQVLRSGTSVGANIEEAVGGYTKKDFRAKMSIAYKEVRETKYWLRLLKETEYLSPEQFESLHADAEEIARMLFRIIESSKS
ncbi:four helix bundle protein [Flavilitoribacter nigricans]|jgi:four helix bundle protein|uniref:Four helix bundle protein n=1 Tax=Flavilitoribacter nigricans (strain ATCC 23147 / DSM 23189 / NBRC 102662 / NCIMB 1420 / SS-2) TaxID=1122177 RepID=A0A2D0N0I8_FLAN2|nr:four helix bundle protein [Flavilitoribacter nigricans]PHN01876.1 four helix bundle protein [Flavilitoribacter nigricans DSM 23189 = NBRC 102662]